MLAEYDGLRGNSREQWSLTRVIVATRNQLGSDFLRLEEGGGVPPPAFRPSSYTGPSFYTQNLRGYFGASDRPGRRASSPPHGEASECECTGWAGLDGASQASGR